ncbi:similar to stage IV sporulation protein [Seinonella peptonophila]|uniref:Similar to stage IV sporulation protein n=1 Tax=Seinonella peptonophila TaxID=112248 RepID=A0A1M4V7M6_9BACL|nr:sporulation protein YqfD [Seinonella peptonophila]SHE64890.1 similar to stage IV sporulation protein [Seinonella peptonophila]
MANNITTKLCVGKVQLECQGERIQDWLRQVVHEQIELEQTIWLDTKKIRFIILLTDFHRVVRMIRQYRLQMKIVQKRGMPFIVSQAYKRKFFFLGIGLFFLLLIVMSSFIWRVDIVGSEQIPEGVIRSLLVREGIFVGQWKTALPKAEEVQHRLLEQLPDASWIGYRIEGTRALIVIVEKKRIEKHLDEIPSYGPVHLVARKQGLIRDMKILKGHPEVEVSDMVKKGQRLVSGIYGEDEETGKGQVVGAQGKVFGEVWYETDVAIPLNQVGNLYTGRREQAYFPYIGGQVLRIDWFQRPKSRNFTPMSFIQPLQIMGKRLPFGLIREEYRETMVQKRHLSVSQAALLARTQAREECLKMIGKDGKIIEEKVLHQNVENGKVYLKLHFDVIEDIATPQPILQGE